MEALKGVDIDVFPEEFLIIFGPSGCGKSTVLYSLSGVEEDIDSGEIWYKDRNIREMNRSEFIMFHRHAIGMIFQGYQLIPTLNVLNNVTLPLVFEGVPKSERKKRGTEILEHFGLSQVAKQLPTELSGGQQQRVGIARALINNPEIIVADEPTGNLDSETAVNVLNTLKELCQNMKKTVILVTHESQYLPYANRIIFMKDGNVVDQAQGAAKNGGPVELGKYNDEQKDLHLHAIKTIDFLGYNTASEEYDRMEEGIRSYFERKIDRDQLFALLHKPLKDGGVGLYRQKAERLTNEVQEVLELSAVAKGVQNDEEKVANIKIGYVTDWMLKVFHGHMTPQQKNKVVFLVSERMKGKINHPQLEDQLNLSEEKGGAGLHSHTAHNISQRLEVIL